MPKLNPNHPVTQLLDHEFMHKITAVLVLKFGAGRVIVTPADIAALVDLYDGEMPTLITHAHADSIEFRLVPESEAREIARDAGGLSV